MGTRDPGADSRAAPLLFLPSRLTQCGGMLNILPLPLRARLAISEFNASFSHKEGHDEDGSKPGEVLGFQF